MYFNSIYILNLTRHYYYFLIYYQYSFSFTIYLPFSLFSIPSFISMLLLGVIFLLLSKCSLNVGFYWLEFGLYFVLASCLEKQSTLGCQGGALVEPGCPGYHRLERKSTPSF